MTAPLSPERLARLLEDAVGPVTARPGTLDRIRLAARRRRAARRARALLLAAAVIAAGSATALALVPGGTPAVVSYGLEKTGPPSYVGAARAPAVSLRPAHAPVGVAALMLPAGQAAAAAIEPIGDAATTNSFLLVAYIPGWGAQTVAFTAPSAAAFPPSGPTVIGSADAAGDGQGEIFVQVGRGCCAQFWIIFRLVGGHLRQVSLYGRPAELAVGGNVVTGGGFSCEGPGHDLVAYGYSGESGGLFLATRTTYRWAGAALVLVSRQQTSIRAAGLARYRGVSCGDLSP